MSHGHPSRPFLSPTNHLNRDRMISTSTLTQALEARQQSPMSRLNTTLFLDQGAMPAAAPTATGRIDPGRRAQIVADYPTAFTDTYGTSSGSPFLYKTGVVWHNEPDPDGYLSRRQIYAVNNHPITSSWAPIALEVYAYAEAQLLPLTAVMGLGWGNEKDEKAFCRLLMTIGMDPDSVSFDKAKTFADYVKGVILEGAGFPDIDVAVWEWTTCFSATGLNLKTLDPIDDAARAEFASPFASTLPLTVAPLKEPYHQGTAGLFLRRGRDSNRILALTAAHVARPQRANLGLKEKGRHIEQIILLGETAYKEAIGKIKSRIATQQDIIVDAQKAIKKYQERHAEGTRDPEKIAKHDRRVQIASDCIEDLSPLQTRVSKIPKDRVIGHVLHCDTVQASEDGRFTLDWAVIELNHNAIDWDDFQGNQVYVGDKLDNQQFKALMYPWPADLAGYSNLEDNLLPIFGVVPESELLKPTQHNISGDVAMPVIKSGATTGTTVGWLNSLDSLVRRDRHYSLYNMPPTDLSTDDKADNSLWFKSFETTIVPYGRRGAFSEPGDSGSMILDRKGRIVSLLTGGGGITDENDLTFSTAWCKLEPHIKDTLRGVHIY